MDVHPWWQAFGETAADHSGLPPRAVALANALSAGIPGVDLIEIKTSPTGALVALRVDVDVERPQDLAHDIRGNEPVAVVISAEVERQPSVLALRADFPDTPHQNEKPEGGPCSLCVDDRPWNEAKLTWTPTDAMRRVQHWLAKAARGELHDVGRPLDPIFFRSAHTLIVPRGALAPASKPVELVGFVHDEDNRVVTARPLAELGGRVPPNGRMLVLAFRVGEQPMMRLRHAPTSLAGLAKEMSECGTDLVKELRALTVEWAGMQGEDVRRLSSRLAILVAFPISRADGDPVDDFRAFITDQTAGEIGVALGTLFPNSSEKGSKGAYVRALQASAPNMEGLKLDPTEVQFAFDRELAAAAAGREVDRRRSVLVGAGSLGSQLALDLAREGSFTWSVVDNDRLMPHNVARHGLLAADVGLPKATALAHHLGELLGEPATPIVVDVTAPTSDVNKNLVDALSSAEIIIDASASVAAARYLSDFAQAGARRVSAFFNPAGTDVVLLTEASDRSVTLRDLEAQYHRLIQLSRELKGHLMAELNGLRYSGSCRSVSNRIPATRAAVLSALAANGIRNSLKTDEGSIHIWRLNDDGEVRLLRQAARKTTSAKVGDWTLVYDDGVLDQLTAMRTACLPNETGGVLLGIADISRRSLHIVAGMPQPSDSVGSVTGFERGIVGLGDVVNNAIVTSLHQIRYLGEWHSHPPRSSPLPSSIDLRQLAWLRHELEAEGLPALMTIAADDGRFSFILAQRSESVGSPDVKPASKKALS